MEQPPTPYAGAKELETLSPLGVTGSSTKANNPETHPKKKKQKKGKQKGEPWGEEEEAVTERSITSLGVLHPASVLLRVLLVRLPMPNFRKWSVWLILDLQGGVTPIDPVLPPATGVN